MSLSLAVRVNDRDSLAVVEVVRSSHVDVDTLPADTSVAYEVTLLRRRGDDDTHPLEVVRTATLQHRYGDGAVNLAFAAFALVLHGTTP